jgi:hypothetical protein
MERGMIHCISFSVYAQKWRQNACSSWHLRCEATIKTAACIELSHHNCPPLYWSMLQLDSNCHFFFFDFRFLFPYNQ